MSEIIVSTGEMNREYDILKILHISHSKSMNQNKFGTQYLSDDKIFDLLLAELKKEALTLKADAIVHLKLEIVSESIGLRFFLYGTCVKFK